MSPFFQVSHILIGLQALLDLPFFTFSSQFFLFHFSNQFFAILVQGYKRGEL